MELILQESQSSSRRTAFIYAGLAIMIGSAVGLIVTELQDPFFLVLAVGGLAVIIATVASAEFGLLLFVFITYTRFSDIAIAQYNAPSVAKFFVVLLIIAILIRWALLGELPADWQVPALLLALYGFVGFLSLIYAAHEEPVLHTLGDYAKDAVIALGIIMLLKRGTAFRQVIWTLIAVGIFLGTLSVFQYLTGTFSNNYGGFANAELRNIAGSTSGYRLTGPIHDGNFFAQIMLVLIPIAIERMLHERKLFLRLLAGLAGVLSTLTVIFTFSRGGFLAMVVVLAILFVMYPPRPLQLAILIGLGLGIFALVPPTYYDRILTLQDLIPNQSGRIDIRTDNSIQGRASQNLTGWAMFKQKPFLGIGLNNFSYLYPTYSKEIGLAPNAATRALHNHYLEVATETGIVGLSVFLSLIWYALRSVARVRQKFLEASQGDYAHLVTGLTIGFMGYLVAAIFVPVSFPRYFYLLLGIMYSLPAVAEQVRRKASAQGIRPKLQQ
jgi:putative inorganic carbon (HCO3(-)) transporter